jgi:MscS family membrane protein
MLQAQRLLLIFVLLLGAIAAVPSHAQVSLDPQAAETPTTPETAETVDAEVEPSADDATIAGAISENSTKNDDGMASALTAIGSVFEETPWWGWVILATGIFLGLFAGKMVQLFLRSAGEKLTSRGWPIRGLLFIDAASPLSLALFTFGITLGINLGLKLPDDPDMAWFIGKILQFLYILALGWFIFNIVDIVDHGLRKITASETNKLSAQIVPLVRKTLRVFIVIVFSLFIAQNVFEVNITAWLAGLGIAGLAVSLAAQDSIKNLFGSITVLLDKPFAVGDRIQFGDADGFVEEIGFRSTRLRTFTGHLITIPNMKFIDGNVENISARAFIRRTMNITITYDTPPEKIDEGIQIVKDLLSTPDLQEPFDLEARPPRVYFNDLNADSLNIAVSYWYFLNAELGRDWWGYMDHAQEFNRRLMRSFGEAGIDFAFPTQTLYLAGDPDRQLSLRLLQDAPTQ